MILDDIKQSINSIIDRMKKIACVENDKELAEILNTSPNTFSSWKNQYGIIPIDALLTFYSKYDVSLDFIVFGKTMDKDSLQIPFIEDLNEDIHIQYANPTNNITIPKTNIFEPKSHKIMCFQTIDNQLPVTAPKGSFVLIDISDKNAGWGCELFLISTDYGYLLRKIVAIPEGAENYEFILKSENKDIGDSKLSKFKIIGKVIGAVKWNK